MVFEPVTMWIFLACLMIFQYWCKMDDLPHSGLPSNYLYKGPEAR